MDDAEAAAARKEGLKAKMMEKSKDTTRCFCVPIDPTRFSIFGFDLSNWSDARKEDSFFDIWLGSTQRRRTSLGT